MSSPALLYILAGSLAASLVLARIRTEEGEDFRTQPRDEWPAGMSNAPSPYILYGPHGYKTFAHSRCQEVRFNLFRDVGFNLIILRYQQQRFHLERSKEIGFFKSMSTATMANLLVPTLPIFAQKLG